jgi:hypothetical protein
LNHYLDYGYSSSNVVYYSFYWPWGPNLSSFTFLTSFAYLLPGNKSCNVIVVVVAASHFLKNQFEILQ